MSVPSSQRDKPTTYLNILSRPTQMQIDFTVLIKPKVKRCKECRAEARMKTEIREKEDAGLMGAWSHAQYAGETEREKHTENSISK